MRSDEPDRQWQSLAACVSWGGPAGFRSLPSTAPGSKCNPGDHCAKTRWKESSRWIELKCQGPKALWEQEGKMRPGDSGEFNLYLLPRVSIPTRGTPGRQKIYRSNSGSGSDEETQTGNRTGSGRAHFRRVDQERRHGRNGPAPYHLSEGETRVVRALLKLICSI